jgi:hypothetical protein
MLGAASVILAEVVSYSSPFPFFDGWGLLVVFPLYTLHTLVLAWVVFRAKRITFTTLFLAGAIFGLYEAYITKVLWAPTWGDTVWLVGGLSIVQTAVLVLYWHPLMAFIAPLMVSEGAFTVSPEALSSLPKFLHRLVSGRSAILPALAFAIFCGFTQGANSPSAAISLLSGLASAIIYGALALVWRRTTHGRTYRLRELLPSKREAIFLGALLLINYLWQGLLIRPDAIPRTLEPHLTVWGIYLFLGTLLVFTIRRAGMPAQTVCDETPITLPLPEEIRTAPLISWKPVALFWIVFPLTSAIATLIKPVAVLVVLSSWAIGVGMGFFIIARAAIKLFRTSVG